MMVYYPPAWASPPAAVVVYGRGAWPSRCVWAFYWGTA